MKRVVIWITVLMLCLGMLSGCGKNKEESSSSTSENSNSSLSSSDVSKATEMVKVAVVKGASSGLNVRATASLDGEKLATVYNDDTFRLASETLDGDWYQISYNGTTAYLNQEYVDIKEITADEWASIEASAADNNSSASSNSDNSASSSSSESSTSSSSESSASSSSESSAEDTDNSELNTRSRQDVEN